MTPRIPARAFTLLELLASIAVIGVLLSILLPTLSGARSAARFTGALANSRTMIQALTMYTADHRDTHPYLLASEFAHVERPPIPMGPQHGAPPYTQQQYWAMALARHTPDVLPLLYPDLGHFQWQKERDESRGLVSGCFIASATLFAAPTYFSDSVPPQWNHLRPTRSTEIVHPSAKMLTDDWSSVWLNPDPNSENDSLVRAAYGFADGSAAVYTFAQFNAPFVARNTVSRDGPGFTTLHGLAGRDR